MVSFLEGQSFFKNDFFFVLQTQKREFSKSWGKVHYKWIFYSFLSTYIFKYEWLCQGVNLPWQSRFQDKYLRVLPFIFLQMLQNIFWIQWFWVHMCLLWMELIVQGAMLHPLKQLATAKLCFPMVTDFLITCPCHSSYSDLYDFSHPLRWMAPSDHKVEMIQAQLESSRTYRNTMHKRERT